MTDKSYIALFSGVAALAAGLFYSLWALVVIFRQSSHELLGGIAVIVGIVSKIRNLR